MISAKQAMNSIGRYIREFSQYIPSNDIRLEEMEPDADKQEWVITVSYPENPLSDSKRIYKKFRVDGNEMRDAEVISMKNVTIEAQI